MRNFGAVIMISSLTVLVSCSGSKNSSSGPGNPGVGDPMTAQFIDAPVKGLKFKTESGVDSSTGDAGKFTCKRGELVTFSLGGLNLGHAACGDQIFVQDLASNSAGYSWSQAASALQTFAIDKTEILDLSVVDQSKIDLSAITYTNFDGPIASAHTAALGVAYDGVDSSDTLPSVVIPAAAAAAANTYLANSIVLPDLLNTVLFRFNGAIKLKGTLAKGTLSPVGGEELCWNKLDVNASVVTANGGAYQFAVQKALGYTQDSDLTSDGSSCAITDKDECDVIQQSYIPKPKMITNNQIDMIYSGSVTEQGYQADAINLLSLNIGIGTNIVQIAGDYQSKATFTTGPFVGKSVVCHYKISGSKEVRTGDDKPEDNDEE